MEADIAKAVLTYARLDLTEQTSFVFGDINPRPSKQEKIKGLVASFRSHGIHRWLSQNAIPVKYSRALLTVEPILTVPEEPMQLPDLKTMFVNLVTQVRPLGGQHRYHALRAYVAELPGRIRTLEKDISRCIKEVESAEQELAEADTDAHSGLERALANRQQQLAHKQQELARDQRDLADGGHWLFIVYDEGTYFFLSALP